MSPASNNRKKHRQYFLISLPSKRIKISPYIIKSKCHAYMIPQIYVTLLNIVMTIDLDKIRKVHFRKQSLRDFINNGIKLIEQYTASLYSLSICHTNYNEYLFLDLHSGLHTICSSCHVYMYHLEELMSQGAPEIITCFD